MKKVISAIVSLVLVLLVFLPANVSANAAQPPFLSINSVNMPDDVEVTIEIPGDSKLVEKGRVKKKSWEKLIFFYWSSDLKKKQLYDAEIVFRQGGEEVYRLNYPETHIGKYNERWFFNYESKEMTYSDPLGRQILLVGLRVGITLLLEGIIFYLFGYRDRKSWIVFLVVNLITQTFLNYTLLGNNFGYVFLSFIILELLIIIVESIALSIGIKEKKKGITVSYAIIANLVSLFAGGWMLGQLPL